MDTGLIEHASMMLAAKAGIRVAATRPVEVLGGHAVAVRRFDRVPGRRLPAQSAYVALCAEGSEFGYPELAQLLRWRGPVDMAAAHMRELFRRMDVLSKAASFRLSAAEARREARQVAQVCSGWRAHFAQVGVGAADLALLGRFIDRPALVRERAALL